MSKYSERFYRTLCDRSFFFFVRLVGGSAGQGGIINRAIHLTLCLFWQNPLFKRIAIFMPRGWLKCVHPDTLVQMEDGSERKISDIRIGDRIVGYSGFKQTASTVINKQSQLANMYRIRFRSGREIIASDKHRFMQVDGYKTLPEYGAYPRGLRTEPTSSISEDEAALISYYVAEGCITGGNMSFTNGLPEVQKDFERIFQDRGWSYIKQLKPGCCEYRANGGEKRGKHKGGPRAWAREVGIFGKSSFEKTLPDSIMASPSNVTKRVIEVLFATDGTIGIYAGYPNIVYTSVNKALCLQIQNLLNRFNVFSTIIYVKNKYAGAYQLKVRGKDSFVRFVESFDVIGKGAAVSGLANFLDGWSESPDASTPNLIPHEAKALIKERSLRKDGIRIDNKYWMSRSKAASIPSIKHLSESDVNWDRVVSCEPLGEMVAYDIETTSKNYIANGIITHNSTLFTMWGAVWSYLQNPNIRILIISQNADLASRFLYFIQKQILTNKVLRKLYPELLQVDNSWVKSHRWSSTYLDLPRTIEAKESTITSVGVGGAAQSGHYDLVLVDDPVGQKHIDSPVELEKVLRYHDNIKELLVNPNHESPDGSKICVVATHWGPGDYGCYIQQKYPEYKWRIVPCLKLSSLKDSDTIEYVQDPTAEDGESNWVNPPDERYTTAYYAAMKNNPEQQLIFWSQHMNLPEKAAGLTKFDKNWLRYFHFEEINGDQWVVCENRDGTDGEKFRVNALRLRGMIDPGGFSETKQTKGSSRCAIMIGGQPAGSNKKFIIYTHADKVREPSKFMDKLFAAHQAFNVIAWEVEVYAQQRFFLNSILEERKKRGIHLPIFDLPCDMSKGVKDQEIAGLILPFENGEIFIHQSMKEFIGEYVSYPGGMTKDLLDCAGKLNRYHFIGHAVPLTRQKTFSRFGSQPQAQRNSLTGY